MSSPRAISFSTSTPAGSRSSSAAAARGDARPSMNPSDIPWIGDIPEAWGIKRGKAILTPLKRPVRVDDEIITCFRDGEVTLRKTRREDGFTVAEKEIGYQGVEKDDLIVHGMDGFAGSIGISDSRGKASPVLIVLDSPEHKRFLMYYLRSLALCDVFLSLATGVRERSCDLRWNKIGNLPFLLPPLPEQRAIAAFLDDKCAAIDALADEAKASLSEYADWKRSIIFHAVTKGIPADGGGRPSSAAAARGDARPPMKDSGVEWIGNIPAHWQVLPLKTQTDMLTPMRDRPEHLDGPIPWIRIEDFDGKYIAASKDGLGVSEETVRLMNLKVYPVGTVLCTSSCDLGKCAIVSTPLVSNQRFIGIVPKAGLLSDFLYYLMLSNADRLNMLSTGTIQANLSRVEFERLQVQIPPLAEQRAIATWLDEKCAAIEALVEEKKRLLDDLASYKKSLIYETVTGKRRVLR